ncbi:MAG: hypothetical protein PHX30_00415 [Candidatus Pacebacteria bacterium]|nr:hypothetical protein [Candidatus Paceibacterota bacterium]
MEKVPSPESFGTEKEKNETKSPEKNSDVLKVPGITVKGGGEWARRIVEGEIKRR